MYQHDPHRPPDTGTLYTPPTTTPEPPRRWYIPAWVPTLIIVGIAVVASVGAVLMSDGDSDPAGGGSAVDILAERVEQQPPLQRAVSACQPSADEPGLRSDSIRVGDQGRSLSIDGAGLASGPDIVTVACVLGMLDVPDSVVSRIDNTRALDGTQTAEWDDYSASWTYHPDSGLNMVIEQR